MTITSPRPTTERPTATPPPTATGKAIGKVARGVDDRFAGSGFLRRSLNKVFPDHWSFMIGEIALYSFVILLLTGTYLTFFYVPSINEVVYNGTYVPLQGVTMSEAYKSALDISFDVRGGLLIRQLHHWAALLFLASIVAHLCRVFFTGAFRKPREINWVIGVGLLVLGILEGFSGYSLADDQLSGTGLRIAYSIVEGIPVAGTWVAYLLFGGAFPGDQILHRLYVAHILLIPGVILGLITAHMGILWHQKHTQFPGPGKTEHNVVGERLFPVYAAKAGGFFFLVFGVLAAISGAAQINPVWLFGPYDPSNVSAGSQPDWYMGFLDGSTRLMPAWEFRAFGHTVPALFWPTVVLPGILFTLLAVYPWLEAKFTRDKAYHNLLERPRDNANRTAIGAMSLTFYIVLLLGGGTDLIAVMFNVSLNKVLWAGRILLIVAPPIAFWATRRLCRGLQAADHERQHHGLETGIIRRLPSGEFVEVSVPEPTPAAIVLTPIESDHAEQNGNGKQKSLVGTASRAVGGFFVKRDDDE